MHCIYDLFLNNIHTLIKNYQLLSVIIYLIVTSQIDLISDGNIFKINEKTYLQSQCRILRGNKLSVTTRG